MKNRCELDMIELEQVLPQEAQQLDEQLTTNLSLTMLQAEIEQAKAELRNARLEKLTKMPSRIMINKRLISIRKMLI